MRRRLSMLPLCLSCLICGPINAGERRAAVLTCDLPGHSPALTKVLTDVLTSSGYKVEQLSLDVLYKVNGLATNPPDLLVLPNAAVVPAKAVLGIERYLRTGGDLIALRTPLSSNAPIRVDAQWVNKDEYLAGQAGNLPPHVLYDWTAGLMDWQRQTNHPEWPSVVEPLADQPAAGRHAVHVTMKSLDGWDTHQKSVSPGTFPAGHTLTILAAKGSERTQNLSVEWEEKDGSRWIAVTPLSPKMWKRHVLAPSDFKYWSSVPARAHTQFNPANAAVLRIGLAQSHTGMIGGPHEYWLGPVGTAPRTDDLDQLIGDTALPPLDTLCPGYKMFDCRHVALLMLRFADPPFSFDGPWIARSPQPRAGGIGFDKGRDWRWIPFIEAFDAPKIKAPLEWRGTPGTLTINADGPYKGSIWMSVGIENEWWYQTPPAIDALRRAIAQIKRGVFILDGGADRFTYFDDQPLRLGATLVNLGKEPTGDDTLLHIFASSVEPHQVGGDPHRPGFLGFEQKWPLQLKPGERRQMSTTYTPKEWPAQYFVEASVYEGKGESRALVDRVEGKACVYRPKPEKHFVTIKDGQFMLDGKRWRPHGINYMPSSGIGTEDGKHFENWTGPQSYDPTVIDRDLQHIKDMGYNAVSVFTEFSSYKAQNILDLVRRCEVLGLKVNLFLRPSSPKQYDFAPIRQMIEQLRLTENDTVFAYDIDWEPHFGKQADRVIWDRDWEAWIVERYGSVANAEKDWGFGVPRDAAGKVTNPSQEQILVNGPWKRMVAAYRRFLDTLLYQKYSTARRLIRGVDANHLVSFRMTETGNPTCTWGELIPYDFPYLVNAVDFLAPEAYGRIGDWEKVKPGWFEREYARWADPGKPMIWAEMGMSTWFTGLAGNSPQQLVSQGEFYRHFYRMMIASSADGIFSWWYPGGFRCGENSDFGIINPDGSDRPVTKVIREMAQPFIDGADLKPIDTWIEFDRDADATGIVGAYAVVKDKFWKAIDEGHTPGLRTAGTGTDSRNCPPLAVGNTPMNGSNPPKYLDAMFDLVEIRNAAGQWVPVSKGAKIPATGNTTTLRVTMTNLGEAAWIADRGSPAAPEAIGAVFLEVQQGAALGQYPLASNVPHRGRFESAEISLTRLDQPGEVCLTLRAVGRSQFGERFTFTLLPGR